MQRDMGRESGTGKKQRKQYRDRKWKIDRVIGWEYAERKISKRQTTTYKQVVQFLMQSASKK